MSRSVAYIKLSDELYAAFQKESAVRRAEQEMTQAASAWWVGTCNETYMTTVKRMQQSLQIRHLARLQERFLALKP